MSSSLPQFIEIKIRTQADNPALLEGLETWLSLGLLSDEQVKQISQQYLSQRLPQPRLKKTPQLTNPKAVSQPIIPESPQLNFIKKLAQSFKAELSVRWLLFLGLFMVVVSSGVLAASQWEKFPALGQYGVLFAYTLGFFTASFWASRSSQLPLTAQTLRWVTLLLIPLNFWAINRLGLLQNTITFLVVAIAIIILTGIVILFNSLQRRSNPLPIINQLILSYLHLGWGISGFPLLAVYIGIFSSAGVSLRYPSHNKNPTFLAYIIPFIFLLIRVILVSNIPWKNIIFPIGLGGYLLYIHSSQLWRRIAYSILGISWLLSVGNHPWQVFGITLLVLHLLIQDLKQFWQRKYIIASYLVGLQTYILAGRLIPDIGREAIINSATQLTQSQNQLSALVSLSWFPYVILWVMVTEWLNRKSQPKLAKFSQQVNFGFGCFLTLIAIHNPIVRSLNLLLSTITFVILTRRHASRLRIYLTHLTALFTIVSWVEWLFSPSSAQQWAVVLLGLMLVEWSFYSWRLKKSDSTIDFLQKALLKSSGYLGLGLAEFSYILLLNNFDLYSLVNCSDIQCFQFPDWGITWLITPLTLTGIAYVNQSQDEVDHPPQNPSIFQEIKWSNLACILLQFLTIGLPRIRLISLAISTIILFLNSRLKPTLEQASLTVGFALATLWFFLWEGIPTLSLTHAFVIVAIILNSLWLLHHYLIHNETPFTQSYRMAINYWGTILCAVELISLTLYTAAIYNKILPPSTSIIIATSLILIAILYRGWTLTQQQTNTEDNQQIKFPFIIIYCFSWVLELLMAQILSFTPSSTVNLAIANVLVGLLTQGISSRLNLQIKNIRFPHPLQIIPLCYGLLGILFRINHFDQLTGLIGLGTSLIFVAAGSRRHNFKPFVYLGLFGISLFTGQLVLYQVSSEPWSQQYLAVATVGTSLLYGYRILSNPLMHWTQLSESELKTIADSHYAIANVFWLISLPILPNHLLGLSVGTGVFLIRYAIMQGRVTEDETEAETWVYFGILQTLYFIYFTTPTAWINILLLPWMGAIISVIAYFLYFLPWQSWGWSVKPWRRAAVILPVSLATVSLVLVPQTYETYSYISIVITVIFYLALARISQKIRLTYSALGLANLGIFRELLSTEINLDLVWWVTPVALSCLYIAQIDPSLKQPQKRQQRHWIRCLATGLICGAALFSYQWTGIIPGIFSLVAIFAGLGLRIRAFLYIGTATFLINACNQLIILNSTYSFLKWVIGFIVGLCLIWIAANFETRREQILSLLQDKSTDFEQWE
ncbi:MAG: hypothetical protein WBA13_10110 [Microcoleaceae cyanobacterium]